MLANAPVRDFGMLMFDCGIEKLDAIVAASVPRELPAKETAKRFVVVLFTVVAHFLNSLVQRNHHLGAFAGFELDPAAAVFAFESGSVVVAIVIAAAQFCQGSQRANLMIASAFKLFANQR